MAGTPLQKRSHDFFVSYGHADKPVVDAVVEWLSRSAGLKLWYDAISGDASKRSTDLLTTAIQSARGCLFFLSPNWVESTWCKDEHEVALTERRSNDAFLIVAIKIQSLKIPTWFQTSKVIDWFEFNARSAAELLRSLSPETPQRMDNEQDVYFSGPWSRPSNVAKLTLSTILQVGWRLVGDSQDHPKFKDSTSRITFIIQTCRGLVAVLPYDESRPPSYTSPWIINEVNIALKCDKPFLLLAEENVQVPPELLEKAFGGRAITVSGNDLESVLREPLNDFDEDLSRRAHSDTNAYAFLVTSLLEENQETDELASVIESASNLKCIRGHNLAGQHVQNAIIDRIRRAAFCIADVSNDSKNSLIEAGVALGAGTPLHLLSQPPADGSFKRRFMFEDMEMNWYRNSLERLGSTYRLSRPYRRRVICKV